MPSGSRFPDTRWSLVYGVRNDALRRGAFEALCARYWRPIYTTLRRYGQTPADAEDLTQGFFLHLIEHDTVVRADPARGRFRAFLLGALRWFLANQAERSRARKRGSNSRAIPIDVAEAESSLAIDPATTTSFELLFDREWAHTVVCNALRLLDAENAGRLPRGSYRALRACIDPAAKAPSYALLAVRVGISEGAVKVAVHRLRQRFRELLRAEVECTVATARDIDDELRHLCDVFAATLEPT